MNGFGPPASFVHVPQERVIRILLSVASVLAACTPSPQKAAMPNPGPAPGTTAQSSDKSGPAPVAVADRAAAGQRADTAAEAEGRRILSTAFVRLGPGGHLTVELRDGRTLVLRDVVMRPRDYCGVQAAGEPARFCGGYAEVAAARPGGAPSPGAPDPATLNPAELKRSPSG
jgi:hypothetical protein